MGARAIGRGSANVVGVQDGTAIHYNPAALAKIRGTTLMYNHTLMFHNTSFQRAPVGAGLDDPAQAWGDNAGATFDEATSDTKLFPILGTLAVTTDFGLDNWTFAAGAFGPNGVGRQDYPDYGPQSFMLTELDVLVAYYVLGAAWKYKDIFGVGATVHYADLIQLKYGIVTDSTVTPGLAPIPDEASTQLISELDLKDRTGATAQIGFWYRPHERIELGLSSRFVPIFWKPTGGINVDKDTLVTEELSVEMEKLVLPAIVRGGVRYIHDNGKRQWFDLELDAVYESWSLVESFDLNIDGQLNGQEIQDIEIDKQWRDTVSVRLGGDVNVLPPYLTLRAGGFFETAATPKNYTNLDFPSFNRGGVGVGFSAGAKGAYFTVGYTHVFQETRNIEELTGKVFQERPLRPCPDNCNGASGVPANAGRFVSSFDLLAFGIDLRFREMLAGRRERKARAKGNGKEPSPSKSAPAQPAQPAEDPAVESLDGPEPRPQPQPAADPAPTPDDPDPSESASPDATPSVAGPSMGLIGMWQRR